MKKIILFAFAALVCNSADAQDNYRTLLNGGGNWDGASTWEKDNAGDLVFSPTAVAPTDANSISITIQGGDVVTIPSALTVNADQLTVQELGTIDINSGGILNIVDGTGDDVTLLEGFDFGLINVSGTLKNQGQINSSAATLYFLSGGKYQHNVNGGNIPYADWNANSTCEIIGIVAAITLGQLDQTFGHFTWNNAGQTTSAFNLAGNLATVAGNLNISNTGGTRLVALTNSETGKTINITGDLNITGTSRLGITNTGSATVNATNFNFSSTSASGTLINSSGQGTINVAGNFTMSAGILTMSSGSSASGIGTLNVTGAFSFTAGTIRETNTAPAGVGNINFNGTATQTFTSGGTFSGTINFTVNNGAIVNFGAANFISGVGTFTVGATGTIHIGSTSGISSGTSSGNIRVSGTRTYTAGATLIYNGVATQSLGDGFPASGVNLTINNSSNVNLSGSTTISTGRILTLTSGNLVVGANTLTIDGTITGSGFLSATNTSNITIGGTGALGTIPFDAGTTQINNFILNRTGSGSATLGSDISIFGGLTLTAGDFIINSTTLTLEGTASRTSGNLSGNSATTILINGVGDLGNFNFAAAGNSIGTLTVDRADPGGAATIGNAFTVNTALNLTTGILTTSGVVTMAAGSSLTRTAGTISSAPTAATSYNVTYLDGAKTTGPELPASATALNNLTINSSGAIITLNADVTVNGILTITSSTLSTGTNRAIDSKGNWVNNGIFTANSGTVTFSGTTTVSGSSTTSFNNVTITGTLTAHATGMNVGGTWSNSGIFTHNSGTVVFNGVTSIAGSSTNSFNNLSITGTLTAPAANMNVAGNWSNTGIFTHNSGTVTFNGATTISGASTNSFNNLTITGTLIAPATNMNVAGNWSNTGIFTHNSGTVTFNGATTISGASINSFNNLTITGTLTAPAANVNVAGTWTNSGTFTHSSGTVTFNGTGAQSIAAGSTTTFYNWILSNAFGVTLSAAVDIASGGTLTLTSGTITINGQTLTLRSTGPTSAANIAAIPNGGADGGITGNYTFERYVGGGSGWRIMYSPVGGDGGAGGDGTIEGWNDDFQMSNFPGSDDPTYGWTSVYYYDETDISGTPNTIDIGYTIPVSSNARVDSGAAIFAYIGPSGITLDQTGSLVKGNQAFAASYTSSGTPGNDGWNLIGNPYPSDIEWGLVGFTGGVVDKAYIYDDAGGYLPAIDASDCILSPPCPIASNIGFWVKTTGSAGTVTFHETDKVASGGTFYKLGPGVVEKILLTINAPNGTYNKTEFQFIDGATPAFDAFIDAYKLYTFNWQGVDIYTQSSDSTKLSTNCWPDTNQSISIPVFVKNRITGTHSITADLTKIPSDKCVYLEDLSDSSMYDLRVNPTISFSFPVTTDANRFMLHIGAPAIATVSNPTCANDTDGFAVVGGVSAGPWTIEWYYVDGADSTLIRTATNISVPDTLQNAAPGTYAVKIIDTSSQCGSVMKSIVISQPEPITALVTKTDLLCYGDSNGTINITPSGGNDSLAVLWSNGITDTMQTGLASGNYSVTMTDSKGCTGTETVLISEPAILSASITKTDITCNGFADGIANVTASGGTGSLSYLWSTGETINSISGKTQGTYLVTVMDVNSCAKTDSVIIIEPSPMAISISKTDISCNGFADGTSQAVASGGTGQLSYSWSTGETATAISGKPAGNFFVTVTDINSCSKTDSAAIAEPLSLSASISKTDVTCSGTADGTALITASGGTGQLSYLWSSGETGTAISGKSAGNFFVTVTDINSCSKTDSAAIAEPSPVTTSASKTDVTCSGVADGTALVNASGGTGQLSYLWSSGETGTVISGKSAGNFFVTVTDINSCSKTDSVAIAEPSPVTSSISQTDVSCNGQNNGSADLTVSGGVSPYTFYWSDSATTEDLTTVSAGNYSVTITDNNSCTKTDGVIITEPAPITIPFTKVDATCFGYNDGSIDISPSGGTSPYTFSWSNSSATEDLSGLVAANYTLTLTDGNLCVQTQNVTVTEPPEVIAGFTASTDTVIINPTGDVQFTNTSTNAVTYSWDFSDGSPNDTAANPLHTFDTVGVFTVILTASNGNGCSDVFNMQIVSEAIISTSFQSKDDRLYIYRGYSGGIFIRFDFTQSATGNIELYNVMGQRIKFIPGCLVYKNTLHLLDSEAEKGIYFFRMTTGEGSYIGKFIY